MSGNLDEYAIQSMVDKQAPIDLFAVGTKVTTSNDFPYMDCVYKLQEYSGRPVRKKSEGKETWPGPKQVYRQYDQHGSITYDLLTMTNDLESGEPLIEQVMKDGKRISSPIALTQSRANAAVQLGCLSEDIRSLREGATVEVEISQALRDLAQIVDAHR